MEANLLRNCCACFYRVDRYLVYNWSLKNQLVLARGLLHQRPVETKKMRNESNVSNKLGALILHQTVDSWVEMLREAVVNSLRKNRLIKSRDLAEDVYDPLWRLGLLRRDYLPQKLLDIKNVAIITVL